MSHQPPQGWLAMATNLWARLRRLCHRPDAEACAARELAALQAYALWAQQGEGQRLGDAEALAINSRAKSCVGTCGLEMSGAGEPLWLPDAPLARRLSVHPSGGTSVRAAFNALPLGDEQMDLVILHHVLDFCADPEAVIEEAARVLHPRGLLLVVVFDPWRSWRFTCWGRSASRGHALPKRSGLGAGCLKRWLRARQLNTLGIEPISVGRDCIDGEGFGQDSLQAGVDTQLQCRPKFTSPALAVRAWLKRGPSYMVIARKQRAPLTLLGGRGRLVVPANTWALAREGKNCRGLGVYVAPLYAKSRPD